MLFIFVLYYYGNMLCINNNVAIKYTPTTSDNKYTIVSAGITPENIEFIKILKNYITWIANDLIFDMITIPKTRKDIGIQMNS